MSEDIYAKPDLTKKVRFQKNEEGNKEEREKNIKDDVDSVTIYDNCWAEGNSPPTVEDNTAEDQQQINSVNVNSEKGNYVKAALLLMGLLCFLLLVTVIVLVSISIVSWSSERNLRIELQKSYEDLERFNQNLTKRSRLLEDEKTNLTIERDQLEAINTNLTSEKYQLKTINSNLTRERDQLEAINTNLTKERDELQLLVASSCPGVWMRFGGHCYFRPNSKKTWHDSKQYCEERGATLAVISNENEQRFISSLKRRLWIGLSDRETENVWKWVNGEEVTRTYWKPRQPDNCLRCGGGEDCAELLAENNPLKNWNDRSCSQREFFICEMALQ